MNIAHTLSRNFVGVTRSYMDEVFSPTHAKVVSAHDPAEVNVLLADQRLRLLFYTPLLAKRMLPAFSHLERTEGAPDLTIHVWDSRGAGIELTQPYYKREHMSQVDDTDSGDGGFYGVYVSGEESIQMYDQKNKSAHFWIHDASTVPGWVIGAPLRAILHWYLSTAGIQLVHGAVVGESGNAVLLTARSGSGKSTTALACVIDGMSYIGDDYVAISPGPEMVAYAIYNSAKCTPNTLDAIPELRKHTREVISVDERKSVVYVAEAFPKQMARQARIKAILVPSLAGASPTSIQSISKAQALLAMVPTTIFQLPYTSTNLISQLRKMVDSTPCYALKLGNEIRIIPKTIRTFLKEQPL